MRILIVEDEYLIASGAASALKQAGCEVVGMAPSVSKALRLFNDHGCDAAVLDANLNGESAEPVAVALRLSGVPYLVLSGYSTDQRTGALADGPFLAKPYRAADLVASVQALRR